MSTNTSPGAKSNRESPLSMLAAIVSNSPTQDMSQSVETKVKCISLGTYQIGNQINSFQLFKLPDGNFFSLEQLNGLFFQMNKPAIMSYLLTEAPRGGIMRDLNTKSIYLSTDIVSGIGEETQNAQLGALAVFAREGKLSNSTSFLSKVDGLTPLSHLDEINLVLNIAPYYPKRNNTKRLMSDEETGKHVKPKNKRLSIDTRFSEKLESNSALLEQMKSSYKVKQQQQAIIDQRTRSAVSSSHPDNSSQSLFPNRTHKKALNREVLNGIDQLVSPRGEFPNRDLPRPRGYEAGSGPTLSQSAHPLSGTNRIPSPQIIVSPPSSQKAMFLNICEQMYDTHESTSKLQQQLKEQIRKSATLLYTLSSSGQMIEGLVRSHFREMQSQYGEKFGAALSDLNRRLVAIEQKTLGSSQSEVFSASGTLRSAIPKDTGTTKLPSIVDRLETLEKTSPS